MKANGFLAGLGLLILAALAPAAAMAETWQQTLHQRIPLYGHRNWIVIADSAYPAQSREGIETVLANASQIDVLKQVLSELSESPHVTPVIYTDRELKFVDDVDAPGIAKYREQLAQTLGNRIPQTVLHEQIIQKLDQAAQTFRVLIVKTSMTIPYTSVFLQLDCAYWGPDAERKLRAIMSGNPAK